MRTRSLGAIGAVITIAMASLPAAAIAVPMTYTGMVVSNEGSGIVGAQVPIFTDLDPGEVTGRFDGTQLSVASGGWHVSLSGGASPLHVGLYEAVDGDIGAFNPGLRVGSTYGSACGLSSSGSFRIIELPTYEPDGTLLSFAADAIWHCPTSLAGWVHVSVRLNAATAPAILRAPTDLALADAPVGSSSVTTMTVQEVGRGAVDIPTLAVTGTDAAMFTLENDTCSGRLVGDGGSCAVDVRFTPTSMGAKSATLAVGGIGLWNHDVSLSGRGRSPLLALPSTLVLMGDDGHWRAGGETLVYDPAAMTDEPYDGTAVRLTYQDGHVWVSPPDGGTIDVGHHVLPVGPASGANVNLQVSVKGAGCGYEDGWVDVIEAPAFDGDGALLSFAADFSTHCDGSDTSLRGTVRFHSTAPGMDLRPPIGHVGPGGMVRSPDVELDVTATDETAVAKVALSNNGTDWVIRDYAPVMGWSLTDPAAGGNPSAGGDKAVYARWQDTLGLWSEVDEAHFVLDTYLPESTTPVVRLPRAVSLTGSRVPVAVSWTSSDLGTGLATHQMSRRVDGGAWSDPVTVGSTMVTLALLPGHTYRFQVRATDAAGNVGPWATSSTFTLSGVQQTSSRFRYTGTWARSSSAAHWGGSLRGSKTAGDKVRFTSTGHGVAWVSRLGPTRGIATVWVNGGRVATVDLYSATWQNTRVVWSANWSTAAARSVVIRVSGTTARPRVDLDGFITRS